MKKIIIFVIYLSFLPLLGEITLNEFGHINSVKEEIDIEYTYDDNEYFVKIDKLKLIGTSVFPLANGYLTIVTEHENIPTWLRIYDKMGYEKFHAIYPKTINLTFSKNKKYVAFSTGKKLIVLNSENLEIVEFINSIIFAVNGQGILVFVDRENNIHFQDHVFSISENIRTVLFQNEIPLIITEHSIYNFGHEFQKIHTFAEEIFEAKIIENSLYLVINNNSKNIEQIDEINFDSSLNRIHEPIYAPLNYGVDDFPFPIGNSYAEIQQYGNTPYLHPGVDFLGDDFQEVYAVHDGFVKAVLTTGGDPYWRVAIANEDSSEETQGYLYAHLNQSSITVNVDDEVVAGDLLGTLYPWGYYDFTHIHFARVFCTGAQWYGDWWTTENNLLDVINIQDTIPPIFEDVWEDNRFAFVDENGTYLDPMALSGEFDIITKCHDIANSDWRIDIHDLSYSLHPIGNTDSTLFEQFSYIYDFDLDTYLNGSVDWMILNTIYSRDATCFSMGNYDEREYFHIITNSNGDSLITVDDAAESFDSSQFPDNYYYFKVKARDACLNTTVDSMLVFFNNGISNVDDQLDIPDVELRNYPNPFNPTTTITFSVTQTFSFVNLEIYNLKGQKVRNIYSNLCHPEPVEGRGKNNYSILWDGTDENNQSVSSGIYFYKLRIDGKDIKSKKMILLR